jgi:hypothetical protein
MAESGSSAIGYGSLTVSTTALDLSTVLATDFTKATHVLVTVETAGVRVRTDGAAPTSTEGHLLNAGDDFSYAGQLSKLQFIRSGGSDATLRCTFSYR